MSDHRVVLIIEPGGEMTSTVEGIAGASCEDKTKWLDAIGTVKTHKRTPDYHAHVTEEQAVTEKATVGSGGSSGQQGGGSHGSPW